MLGRFLVLGVDVVVGEELAGHGRLDQDLLVVLDEVRVQGLRGLVVRGS